MINLQAFDLLVFKENNPGHKVMYINICNKEFVFRTLGKTEYKNILNVCSNEYDLEDMICQVSVLFPNEFDFKDCPIGGLTKTISPLITELSGFTNTEIIHQTYDSYKQEMNTFENKCYALIKIAFPEFTFEEMEDWTWDKTFNIATKAEYILNETKFKDNPIKLVKVEQNVGEEINKLDLIQELRAQGVDPMVHFWNEINQKSDYIDFPLIGSIHWNDEGVINEIRKQITKSSLERAIK